ncbi:MAG: extracellular solute-binding protein [Lachnospiraceae bacterium]|nr:extracellular solute-binding protein [Lachnospiraceae bacterium]
MKIKTWIFIILISAFLGALYFVLKPEPSEKPETAGSVSADALLLWYTDEALDRYVADAAAAFSESNGIKVRVERKNARDYAEAVYKASVENGEYPDLYICGADSLEKLYMMGIAGELKDPAHVVNNLNFPEAALNAVSYKGKLCAYPLSFETAFLLYNAEYLKNMGDQSIRMELDPIGEDDLPWIYREEDDTLPAGYTKEQWDAACVERGRELIPGSIGDIQELASDYRTPEGMESFFNWDVSDIFYNYFFTGAYMNVGGRCGDDPAVMEIRNEDTVRCMHSYQELSGFFSIDPKESSYESVLNDFLEGKVLFTVATTDAVKRISEQDFSYGYGVAALPAVDKDHKASGLSTTVCIAINPYSENVERAELFGAHLCGEGATALYDKSGKLPAMKVSGSEEADRIREIYADSVPLPKLMKLSDFWAELELAYIRVWNGEDPEETLIKLEETMKARVQ